MYRKWRNYLLLKTMEALIIWGGCYALYTVGMAIATELDYRSYNREQLRKIRQRMNDTE